MSKLPIRFTEFIIICNLSQKQPLLRSLRSREAFENLSIYVVIVFVSPLAQSLSSIGGVIVISERRGGREAAMLREIKPTDTFVHTRKLVYWNVSD